MDEAAHLNVRIDATTGRFESGMVRARQVHSRQSAAIEKRAAQMQQRVSRSTRFEFSRQGRASFINFGQQIQDVAVQAEMGTDALRIFSQQGPQILSVFGPAGVTLGILAAVTGAVASSFFESADAAKMSKEAMKGLTAAHSAARDAQELLSLSTEELTERFGENADEVNRLRVELSGLAVEDVRRKVESLTETMSGLFDELTVPGREEQIKQIEEFNPGEAARRTEQLLNALQPLSEAFGITIDQARALNKALLAFEGADTLQEKREVWAEINGQLDAYGVRLEDLPAEIFQAVKQMSNLDLKTIEATATADRLSEAISNGADETGRFIDQAAVLKEELQAAARAARVAFETQSFLLSRRPDIAAEDKLFGLPVAVSSSVTSEITRRNRPKRKRRGGRSRQKRDQFPQQIERVQDRIDALEVERQKIGLTERAAEELSAAFDRERLVRELLNAAQKDGTAATAEEIQRANELADQTQQLTLAIFDEAEALEKVKEASKAAKKEQEDLANSIKSTSDKFINAVKNAESFEDALKAIGLQLLELAANAALGKGPLGGAFNDLIGVSADGIAGLLTSSGSSAASASAASSLPAGFAKGGVFSSGRVTPFASGGIVSGPTTFPMSNGTGLMGEAGPEAIMPLSRGPGGKLGVAASGTGSPVIVNITNTSGADISAEQKGPNLEIMVEQAVARSVAGGGRVHKAIKQTFQLSQPTTRR
jgi:phage-related minor tail protein